MPGADKPFEAYRGDGPYVFVSYAHADSESVYPDLAASTAGVAVEASDQMSYRDSNIGSLNHIRDHQKTAKKCHSADANMYINVKRLPIE